MIQLRLVGVMPARLPTGMASTVRNMCLPPSKIAISSRGFVTSSTSSARVSCSKQPILFCVLRSDAATAAGPKSSFMREVARLMSTTTSSSSSSSPTSGSAPKHAVKGEAIAEATAAEVEGGVSGGARPQGTGPSTPGGKSAYPAKLIIYHAGTGKTSFLAVLKLTTIFVFGFFCLIMTPLYLTAGKEYTYAATVFACGIIPLVYVAWATSPFVAAVHMHLPPFARWSPAILQRFVRTAPPNTRIDIATMSLIGKPRVSSMTIGDLKACKKRLGMVNYERDTELLDKTRKWWRFKAVREFNIQEGNHGKIKTGWVWKELADRIAQDGGRIKEVSKKGKE